MRDLYMKNSDAFMVVFSIIAMSTYLDLEETFLQQIERVRDGKPYGLVIVGKSLFICEVCVRCVLVCLCARVLVCLCALCARVLVYVVCSCACVLVCLCAFELVCLCACVRLSCACVLSCLCACMPLCVYV